MLAASTSLGSRFVVIGVSAALHAAVFAVATRGSTRGGDLATNDTPTVDIALEDVKIDPRAESTPATPPMHASHHHDYPVAPDHDLVDHDPAIVHTPYAPHDHADHDRERAPEHEHEHEHEHEATTPTAAPAAEAAPSDAPAPVFTMTIGAGSSGAHGTVAANGASAAASNAFASSGSGTTEAPLAESAVSSRASLVAGGVPLYPADAREAGIEADVPLEIVVDAAGIVTAARSLEHVGYGLDEAAIGAVRRYRFAPAQRGGRAVAVRMRWVVEFRLR